MARLPWLYKARGVPVKSPVCAICLDRTRGRTLERQLTHGVRIWLCPAHHSVEFMRANAGRNFVVTLMRSWRAHGCFTRARARALDAHLRAIRATGTRTTRPRPGSSAWPRLRREAEHDFARGIPVLTTIARLRERHAAAPPPCPASAPCAAGSLRVAGSGFPRPHLLGPGLSSPEASAREIPHAARCGLVRPTITMLDAALSTILLLRVSFLLVATPGPGALYVVARRSTSRGAGVASMVASSSARSSMSSRSCSGSPRCSSPWPKRSTSCVTAEPRTSSCSGCGAGGEAP